MKDATPFTTDVVGGDQVALGQEDLDARVSRRATSTSIFATAPRMSPPNRAPAEEAAAVPDEPLAPRALTTPAIC
jgi:hypothetical protein